MITNQNIAASLCAEIKAQGKKIVFTNGCFDIIHRGHAYYLAEAKKLGDILLIGLNSDDSVRRLKGESRPINSQDDRAYVLDSLKPTDIVVIFEDDTPYNLISAVRPDVLVKGGDYKPEEIVGADIVKSLGGEVVVIPLVEGKSTTKIIERIGVK